MKFRMEPIKLKGGLLSDPKKLSRVVENALSSAALGVKADFGVTTQTWKHKPRFTIIRKTGERVISTGDKVYQYVDMGTRAHVIRSKGRKPLAFKTGYRAKTSPGRIASTSGGASGPSVFARAVRHPGTKARKFSETIAKKWQRELPQIVQRALDSEI